MKRFAYIQNTEIPGLRAHSVFVVKTTEAADQNGYEAHLLLPKRIVIEWNKNVSLWEHHQIKKDSIKIQYLAGFRFWLLSTLKKITGKYFFTLDTFMFAIQAWSVARNQRIDIVQTTDAHVVFIFNLLSNVYKPKMIFDVHHYPSRWLRNLNSIDLIVCNANGYYDDLVSRGVQSKKILVLPNGYDPFMFSNHKIFHRKDFGLKKSDFVIGFIGRFETFGEEKGIRELLEVVSHIKTKIPVKVFLIGEPESLAKEYEVIARKLHIDDKIIFNQFVPPSDVAGLIQLFDVGWLVYPDSPRFRNHISPMKAMEYAAAKIPIIASDLPSIKSIFPKNAAYYVQFNNISQIEHGILELFGNKKLSYNRTSNAFQIIQKFSWRNRQKLVMDQLQRID